MIGSPARRNGDVGAVVFRSDCPDTQRLPRKGHSESTRPLYSTQTPLANQKPCKSPYLRSLCDRHHPLNPTLPKEHDPGNDRRPGRKVHKINHLGRHARLEFLLPRSHLRRGFKPHATAPIRKSATAGKVRRPRTYPGTAAVAPLRPENRSTSKDSEVGSKNLYPRTAAVALCGRKIAAPPNVLRSGLKTSGPALRPCAAGKP